MLKTALEQQIVRMSANKDDVQSKQILDPKGIAPSIYAGESRGGGGEMYVIENHPADSRVTLDDSGKVQTLTGRMGTGGGNVPMVMEPVIDVEMEVAVRKYPVEHHPQDSRAKISFDGINQPLTSNMEHDPGNGGLVICLQGNGIDRADTAGCNGKGWREDVSYTLNTLDRPAVAYCIGNGQVHDAMSPSREVSKTLNCMEDPMKVMLAYATGNGQVDNMNLSDKFGALDCMHDQKCVVLSVGGVSHEQSEVSVQETSKESETNM